MLPQFSVTKLNYKSMISSVEQFEFFINPKMEKKTVYFGLNQLRFKRKLVDDFGIKDGDLFRIAFLKKEMPIKNLYLIKTSSDDEIGYKVTFANSSYSMSVKGLKDKLNIRSKGNARYEIIEIDGQKVVKIELPGL